MTEVDIEVLRFAGMMGHEFCIVNSVMGTRRILGETDDLDEARKWCAERAGPQNPIIYRRTPIGYKRTA